MENIRIPELLAPVGGWPQLRAAVQNGADAVYMGGPLFNARIKAENFTHEDMKEAICYAHDRNVRVYVTINTLIKDSELEKAFSYVNFLYGAGADAVILQDMGLARLVRKYLPKMDMHLSTQGTVYNKWAVESAKHLGFCRIVPARELSLDEIEDFSAECHGGDNYCEVEVFVHGALCMCYSGQCHMSRVIGGVNGRSGNRGLCAQPCRLAYEDEAGKDRFLLSPKDICTVDMIPELCRAGVDSFKIEGRLKSPQYVAIVTSVYRKYLDMYRAVGKVEVSSEDRQKLLQIFNRGGFSSGYLRGNPGEKLLSGRSPKNQGIYVGAVRSFRKGSTLIDVKLEKPLSIGDGVEVRSGKVTGNVISYLKPLGNGEARIGDIKGKVRVGDKVYKVTDKKLLTAAERSYESDFKRKLPVAMDFTARKGRSPRLSIKELTEVGVSAEIDTETIAQQAINRPLAEERVKTQLAKLGDTVFEAERITVDMDHDISLPVSLINGMRREASEALLAKKREAFTKRRPLPDDELRRISSLERLGDETFLKEHGAGKRGIYIYSRSAAEDFRAEGSAAQMRPDSLCIPLELYMERELRERLAGETEKLGAKLIPYILNISKGNTDHYIEENFSDIIEAVKDTGIMTGNLGWIERFIAADVKVYGDHGLNVYNGQSLKAFLEMGVDIRAYSHEAENFHCGSIPLMITEHPVTADRFIDRKGAGYSVMKWYSGDKYLIFSDEEKEPGTGDELMMSYVR